MFPSIILVQGQAFKTKENFGFHYRLKVKGFFFFFLRNAMESQF